MAATAAICGAPAPAVVAGASLAGAVATVVLVARMRIALRQQLGGPSNLALDFLAACCCASCTGERGCWLFASSIPVCVMHSCAAKQTAKTKRRRQRLGAMCGAELVAVAQQLSRHSCRQWHSDHCVCKGGAWCYSLY